MRVQKRNGTYDDVHFDKITNRIKYLSYDLNVDPSVIAQKVCGQLIDGIATSALDEIAAASCMAMFTIHPDYTALGGRILVDNHKKNTPSTLLEATRLLTHILHPEYVELVEKHHDVYEKMIDYDRDVLIDYFGLKTLQKSYLLRKDGRNVERAQHMWMRVSIFLHRDNFEEVKNTYDALSQKLYTNASPTLFNSGTKRPQLSSCFVKGTLVDTVNRGAVPIEEVIAGDQVVTHKGHVKKVVQTHENELGDRKLLKIFLYSTRGFVVTEDHRMWCYNSDTGLVSWKRADELYANDFVAIPNTSELTRDTLPCVDTPVTPDMMWCLGVLFNSSIVYSSRDATITGLFVSTVDTDIADRLCTVLKGGFNIASDALILNDRGLKINSVFLGTVIENMTKSFPVEFISLRKDLIKAWLSGFLYTCSSDKFNKNVKTVNVTRYSPSIIENLYSMCKIHAIVCNVVSENILSVKNVFKIDAHLNSIEVSGGTSFKMNTHMRNVDGVTFVKFFHSYHWREEQHKHVYTLGVEDDHSYSINGIIAENCFLTTAEDSVEGIFKTLSDCAQISKWAGGLGINISDIRGNDSIIRGTNGKTQGIMPLLKTYNATGRYINQSGKRMGSFAMYIEPWHTDIFDFLNAKKNQGADEERARDLFYALWIPDLFMERVEADGVWSLMCPDECKNLTGTYGDEFNTLYTGYESEGKYRKQIKARKIWDAIIESQIETGTPYMLYKDSVNRKNPQENIGVIKQSNLCTEIVLYTDKDNVSVCNLASIGLPSHVTAEGTFDFDKLENTVRIVTRNLNKVVDLTYYPIPEARNTNLRHRPIGIGIQGLADTFAMLKMVFDGPDARHLNKCIFECIYYASLSESCNLAKIDGPYEDFHGSPMSKGILQFDMWDPNHKHPSDRYDWDKLKEEIKRHGLRNSTLLAPMPTASTSQILGFNECLTGDTPVTDMQGISKPIKNMKPGECVVSYNETFNKLTNSKVTEFLDQGVKNVVELQLLDGRTIKCTPDHKFRVYNNQNEKYEWLMAKDMTHDYSMVMGFAGIVDNEEDEEDWSIVKQYYSSTGGGSDREQYLAIARLCGFTLGDGNAINEYGTTFKVDTLYDTQLIACDLDMLDAPKDYTITDNSINFTIDVGTSITNILNVFLKSGGSGGGVPPVLFEEKCPKAFIREFLAAYTGNDGIAPFLNRVNTKSELTGFNILRAVGNGEAEATRQFFRGIKQLFFKLGISISIFDKKYEQSDMHVFNVKMNNIREYSNLIGCRYNIHKMLRNDALRIYLNYRKNIIDQHSELVNNVFELYSAKTADLDDCLTRAIESYNGIFLHKLSVPMLSYLHKCLEHKCFIDVDMHLDAEDVLKQFDLLKWFTSNPCIVNKVKLCVPVYHIPFLKMTPLEEPEHVYDINIEDTHSFIAQGMVVHNCIEPFTSNLYLRRTLAGEFTCINKYLIKDLTDLGLWSKDLMEKLMYYRGSVQHIKEIPQNIKDLYRTVWEIKQKSLIEMAADRGVYVCMSQSLNLFFDTCNYGKLTSAHFLGWKLGLKTGSYYIRSQAAIDAQMVTIDPEKEKQLEKEKIACPMRPKGAKDFEVCEACSG